MASEQNSLRAIVEDWLGPEPAKRVRITEFRNGRSKDECYICVETLRAGSPITLFFFRHRDGAWRIFPPDRERPAMRVN
nr:hypothetical protein [Paraburkholderia phenoliruptrix]